MLAKRNQQLQSILITNKKLIRVGLVKKNKKHFRTFSIKLWINVLLSLCVGVLLHPVLIKYINKQDICVISFPSEKGVAQNHDLKTPQILQHSCQ